MQRIPHRTGAEWRSCYGLGEKTTDDSIASLWKGPWTAATFRCSSSLRGKWTVRFRSRHNTKHHCDWMKWPLSCWYSQRGLCLGDKTLWGSGEQPAPSKDERLWRLNITSAGITTGGATWWWCLHGGERWVSWIKPNPDSWWRTSQTEAFLPTVCKPLHVSLLHLFYPSTAFCHSLMQHDITVNVHTVSCSSFGEPS